MIATVHWNIYCHYRSQRPSKMPTQIMYPPEPACTSDIFQSKPKSVATQAHKKLTKQDDKSHQKENNVANDLGQQRPLQRKEICLRSVSSRAYPSCQVWHCIRECRQRISWDPIKILAWNPQAGKQAKSRSQNRSKAKNASHNPESSCAG